MSDSDDDLLASADVGSESDDNVSEAPSSEIVNPYPLEGKYKDAADRARLDAMPEIERENILYERAQEMQRYEERRYLAQRRKQMARLVTDEDEDVPAPKRHRGTTGVTSGTKSSLETLKSRRIQQNKRTSQQRRRGADDESDYSQSEASESDENDSDDDQRAYGGSSDLDSEDERIRRSFRRNGRRSNSAEWAEDDEDSKAADEAARSADQTITLSDVNKIRWGKSSFAKFCLTPGFTDAVPGCFLRVNVGTNRDGEAVYRLCQIRKVVPHARYRVLDQVVDEAVVASMAGSERTSQFSSCSDSPCTPSEFDFWVNAMTEAGSTSPSRRRAQLVFNGVRALSKRVLTSEEIDDMVKRRAQSNGQRGANAVSAKAELLHQREIAIDQGDEQLVKEIDEKLRSRGGSSGSSGSSSGGDNSSFGRVESAQSVADKSSRVNERNKRANVEAVRRAEVQANSERRRAGTTAKADPFSRLRTTARVFYSSDAKPGADQSAAKAAAEIKESVKAAKQSQNADSSMPLGAVDDLIARIDIQLDIDI